MPTFRSLHNPDFNLSSHRLPREIVFTKGRYTTEDPDEVRALRRCVSVEEVDGIDDSADVSAPNASSPKPSEPAAEERRFGRFSIRTSFDPNDPLGS